MHSGRRAVQRSFNKLFEYIVDKNKRNEFLCGCFLAVSRLEFGGLPGLMHLAISEYLKKKYSRYALERVRAS